ncbi:MAG TPA: hypothetical protein VGP26_03755 [Actinophytocola sp.]|nr:hypothetical protein [Actinophytocola sp.]
MPVPQHSHMTGPVSSNRDERWVRTYDRPRANTPIARYALESNSLNPPARRAVSHSRASAAPCSACRAPVQPVLVNVSSANACPARCSAVCQTSWWFSVK